ncbi:MAG: VWA domain-containing protein [Actinobacteria bacterium]|nr:VWA domain-containing protein [Actinomycetota bacterium]
MTFDAPIWLLVALAVPLLLGAQWAIQKRRMRYAISYSNTSVLASVATKSSWRRGVPVALFALAWLVLALGMAKPQAEVAIPRDEATIILAVDVSGSMAAEDVTPDRMTAAKAAASSFISKLPGRFRIAVVSFSDLADVLAQPTTDRSSTLDALASLEAEGGTAMGQAIIQSIELVEDDRERLALPTPSIMPSQDASPSPAPDERERVSAVLLLSDGYNTTGVSPIAAAGQARAQDVPVYSIALGTPEGVVTVPDQFGNQRLLPVPPDYQTLEAIASTTDGEYFEAPTDEDLQSVYASLGERIGYTTRPDEVTYAFAGLGALLLLLAAATSILWRGRFP